ncbi:glycosyltransferase [Aeromonas popoffii]|uniref:glycosyltransferase n=1 Tax=Aeromonas popoffii TaxID=70856 RepID=UPI001FCCC945|nr:glycosyltransferase [Aeromonas popoffii]
MQMLTSPAPSVSLQSAIVQIVQHLQPGGLETMVLNLSQANECHQPMHIISLEGTKDTLLAAWPALRPFAEGIHCLDKPAGWSPATLYRLIRLLRKLRPSAVHTHHLGPLLYGGLATRLARVPTLVHTEHDAWYLDDPRQRRLAGLGLHAFRPILVADAIPVANQLQARLGKLTPLVIPNGIDEQRFTPGASELARQTLGLPLGVRLIGCAARLETVKGHALLLDAMATLPDEVHLALAGVGSLQNALQQQCQQLGIAHRVHFLGLVEQMPRFYQGLDLFCLPSLAEGMPLCVLEAQACGVPVVMSAVGAAADIVCPASGQLLEERDPIRLAQLLAQGLLKSCGLRAATRAFVCEQGSLSQMAHAYQALYVR